MIRIFVFLLFPAAALLHRVEYNVIAPASSMAVLVDGHRYLLNATEYPLVHRGLAPAANHWYSYATIVNGDAIEQETETRKPFHGKASALEFFNRTQNEWDIAPVQQVLPPIPAIDRLKSNFHRDGYIPTIHLAANQTELDQMHTHVFDEIEVPVNMTYMSLDGVQTFNGAEVKLAGRGSRWLTKLSYNLKVAKGDTLYGQRRLKIRAMGMDPSYIREYISYKAVSSAGLATSHASFVRLFINGKAVGLFGLVEHFNDPWLSTEFGNGDSDYQQGIFYQAEFMSPQSQAVNHSSDLSYYASNETAYGDEQYTIKAESSSGEADYGPLMELTKFIAEGSLDPKEWERHFDMESVIRSFVMDILLGNSDCYITLTSNYYLYQNGVGSQQFIYIPNDYDTTLGNSFVKVSDMLSGDYRRFPGIDLRPLTNSLLRVPKFNKRFTYLMRYLSENLVNLDVLGPTINDTVHWISKDVEWDQQLPRLSLFDFNNIKSGDVEKVGVSIDIWPYPVDNATGNEYYHNYTERNKLPFHIAVEGPTGYISLTGVKEFIANHTRALAEYYSD